MKKKKNYFISLSLLIIILFYILLPISTGIFGTILPSLGYYPNISTKLSFEFFIDSFETYGLMKSAFLSVFVGLFSTLLSLIISQLVLSKVFFTKFYFYLKKIIIPLIAFPHITMAVGVAFLFASSGFFSRIYSLFVAGLDRPPNSNFFPDDFGFFLILGLILKEVPFFLLMSINVLSQFDSKKYFDSGKILNYSTFSSWLFFVFPQIYKKLRLSIIIVLIFCSSVVDMSYVLAPTTPSTLSIRIIELYQMPDIKNISLASCLSIIQFFLIIGMIGVWLACEMILKNAKSFYFCLMIYLRNMKLGENFLFIMCLFIMSISILCIFVSLIWSMSVAWLYPDLLPKNITINNFTVFLIDFSKSFFNTIYIGFFVSLLSCTIILGWLEITNYLNFKNKYIEFIFFIPLIIPELSFLLGVNYFLIRNNLDGNLISLIWIETLYIIPYTYLVLMPAFRGINVNFIQIAKTYQKSSFNIFFFVKLPLIQKAVFLSLGIGFLVSIALYTPVYFIGDGKISTLSLEVVNLSFGGNRKDLGVVTVLQMILPLLILSLIFYVSKVAVKWRF